MASRNVQMAEMKTLSLARTSAVRYPNMLVTIAIMVVALNQLWLVVPRPIHCVKMAVIWIFPSVREFVIIITQAHTIHTGGPAPTALRSVFSKHIGAMGYLIVKMAAMNMIVH